MDLEKQLTQRTNKIYLLKLQIIEITQNCSKNDSFCIVSYVVYTPTRTVNGNNRSWIQKQFMFDSLKSMRYSTYNGTMTFHIYREVEASVQ